MNQDWTQFLLSQHAIFTQDQCIDFDSEMPQGGKRIYPVPQLAVLKASGNDAAKLLQGQMTCNVNDVTEHRSSLGAFCNPKGRAIATFLLIKRGGDFLLVLPAVLLPSIKERLQKYILRSDVRITDGSEAFCLIGLLEEDEPKEDFGPLFATRQGKAVSVNLSSAQSRSLIVTESEHAADFWTGKVLRENFRPSSSEQWRFLDLVAGLPWLSTATSEEFVPQMLNLDKLGGISFNKGCYTGQEIVARTHYLGKVKRSLFLAEADTADAPAPNAALVDHAADSAQSAGNVLAAAVEGGLCTMQIVLQLADDQDRHAYDLALKDRPELKLRLIPFQS